MRNPGVTPVAGIRVGAVRILSAAAVCVAFTAAATSASAQSIGSPPADRLGGSIAYVAAYNVWLASPDGTGARQLTTDGTPDRPYREPAQAPDGTILAFHGTNELDHLDRTGAPVASPVTLVTLENGAEGLSVAPDGQHVAYTTTGFGQIIDPRFGTPSGSYIYGGTDVATLDGQSVSGAAAPLMLYPSWLNATTLVLGNGTELFTNTLGGAGPQTWLSFEDGCLIEEGCPTATGSAADVTLPVASRDGTTLAYRATPYFGSAGRWLASVTGADDPPQPLCLMPDAGQLTDPGTFAPDGSAFAWDDTTIDPTTFDVTPGQGIWVVALDLDAPDCGTSAARLVIPGGGQPDWGPLAP